MALSNFTAVILKPPTSSTSLCILPCLPKTTLPRTRIKPRINKVRVFKPISALSDPFVLQLAETLEDSLPSTSSPPPVQKLREFSSESLLSTPWPSRKDEPFRFTDTSLIKNSQILPVLSPTEQNLSSLIDSTETLSPYLSIMDGYLVNSSSLVSEFPDGVYVGGLSRLNSELIMKRVSEYVSSFQGDLFWSLNGVGAPDLILVYVPQGCKVKKPLHLRYFSVEGSEKELKTLPISNPRVLVLVEKEGEIGIVEQYVSEDADKCYWTNSVIDVVIGEGANVNHSYIQAQSLSAAHTKWTSVRQVSNLYLHVNAALLVVFLVNGWEPVVISEKKNNLKNYAPPMGLYCPYVTTVQI